MFDFQCHSGSNRMQRRVAQLSFSAITVFLSEREGSQTLSDIL